MSSTLREDHMLWAITSYFNPAGYARRLENYRTFRARLRVPLITVEASVNGRFALQSRDAEILVQRQAPDVMWQKERLLNIALGFLPPECQQVAWLDCDVVLARDDWVEAARAALESHSFVQLFSERCDLKRSATEDPSTSHSNVGVVIESIGNRIVAGRETPGDFFDPDAPILRKVTAGLAWAARRSALDDHGLYDPCILGSGDRAMLCAAAGKFTYGEAALRMTARQSEHYRRWAASFFATTEGRISCIDGRIFHLPHGDLRQRRYGARLEGLRNFCFDPFTDVVVDRDGCWRWSSPKTEMHTYVRDYFESRNEDGHAP